MEKLIADYNEVDIAQELSERVDKIFSILTTFEVEKETANHGYLVSIVMENEKNVFDSPKFDKFIAKVRTLVLKKYAGLSVQYKSIEDQ